MVYNSNGTRPNSWRQRAPTTVGAAAKPTTLHPTRFLNQPNSPLPITLPRTALPLAAMNGTVTTTATTPAASPRTTVKPPPTSTAPTPPSGSTRQLHPAASAPATNGKSKKKADPAPIDPAAMYESLKNRIAALEEEEEVVEEEERRLGECIFPCPGCSFRAHFGLT